MMKFFEAVHGRAVNYMSRGTWVLPVTEAAAEEFAQHIVQATKDVGRSAVVLGPSEYVVRDVPCDLYPELPNIDHSNVDHLGGCCPRCRGTGLVPRRVEAE